MEDCIGGHHGGDEDEGGENGGPHGEDAEEATDEEPGTPAALERLWQVGGGCGGLSLMSRTNELRHSNPRGTNHSVRKDWLPQTSTQRTGLKHQWLLMDRLREALQMKMVPQI